MRQSAFLDGSPLFDLPPPNMNSCAPDDAQFEINREVNASSNPLNLSNNSDQTAATNITHNTYSTITPPLHTQHVSHTQPRSVPLLPQSAFADADHSASHHHNDHDDNDDGFNPFDSTNLFPSSPNRSHNHCDDLFDANDGWPSMHLMSPSNHARSHEPALFPSQFNIHPTGISIASPFRSDHVSAASRTDMNHHAYPPVHSFERSRPPALSIPHFESNSPQFGARKSAHTQLTANFNEILLEENQREPHLFTFPPSHEAPLQQSHAIAPPIAHPAAFPHHQYPQSAVSQASSSHFQSHASEHLPLPTLTRAATPAHHSSLPPPVPQIDMNASYAFHEPLTAISANSNLPPSLTSPVPSTKPSRIALPMFQSQSKQFPSNIRPGLDAAFPPNSAPIMPTMPKMDLIKRAISDPLKPTSAGKENTNNSEEKPKEDKPVKRKRGRPRKYKTEEERRNARRGLRTPSPKKRKMNKRSADRKNLEFVQYFQGDGTGPEMQIEELEPRNAHNKNSSNSNINSNDSSDVVFGPHARGFQRGGSRNGVPAPQKNIIRIYGGRDKSYKKPPNDHEAYGRIRVWKDKIGRQFYDCICNARKPVQDLNKIKSHVLGHDKIVWVCDLCGREFFNNHLQLNAHMKTHKKREIKANEQPIIK